MENKRHDLAKHILYIIMSLLTAIVCGTVLMMVVYCLPIQTIRQNVRNSIPVYETEKEGYYWAPWLSSTHLDNYTDTLMLNAAAFLGSGSIKNDAMMNSWVQYEGSTQSECLIQSVTNDTLEGASVINYARYWHGYLVGLKPLLMFCTMSDIRVLGMCFQFLMLVLVILELYKKGGYRLALPFVFAVLIINPISTALCMQYASVYNITLITVYIMLKEKLYESEKYWHLFLWVGISTAFFDLLTYPLVGLGVNLAILIVLQKNSLKEDIMKMFTSCVTWGVGYAGMWSGKWLISYLLTGNNTVAEGIQTAKYRMMGDAPEASGIDTGSAFAVIRLNVNQLWNKPAKVVLIIVVVWLGLMFFVKKNRFECDKIKELSLFFISLLPFVWYAIIKNHSAIHAWMTYRDLSITIMAMAYMIAYVVRTKPQMKEKDKIKRNGKEPVEWKE